MDRVKENALITAIASRTGTAKQLAELFSMEIPDLRAFTADNLERIKAEHERLTAPERPETEVAPDQLSALWITNKFERLKRLQAIAEETEQMIMHNDAMSASEMATAIREFRSYLMLAAQELGQLLNRGAGEGAMGETLSVEIAGVDMESLR
jgi:hypothetical protein